MKHIAVIVLALLLVVVAPLSQTAAESPPAAALSLDKMPGGFQGPTVRESSRNSVVIRFKAPVSVSGTIDYGNDTQYGSAVDIPKVKAAANHDVSLKGLKAGAGYHYRLTLIDEAGQAYDSGDLEFATEAPAAGGSASTERPREENVASLAASAHIVGVSSTLNGGDNSSEFGALKAIDGLDDTEWASNGDGNQAWIEVGLAQTYTINAVGFRSRKTPDGSGQVSRFTVTTDQGQTAGPFQLPNADRIYYFAVEFTAHSLRFKTVETSGGNSGAVAIEAFGIPAQ
jgi:hypothetical protein